MPRLGSKKSRTGCVQCKVRRVKCDENRPCGACTRYRVECSLLRYAPTSLQARGHSANTEDVQSTPGTSIDGASASPDHESDRNYEKSIACPIAATDHWIHDLELMHHFTAYAYLTMPGHEATKQVWGFSVPQEAFKFPFLMHSILAFSANHLAHLNPQRATHFKLLSGTHHTNAVTTLNSTLPDMGPANCHAIFVAASMIVVNAFADARSHDLDSMIQVFQLIRGIDYVLQKSTPMIKKGPFAAIVTMTTNAPKPPPLLSSFLVEIQASACSPTVDSSPDQIVRLKAAECLRESLQYAIDTSLYPALRATMLWPISIDADFLDVLKTKADPEVRELLRKYCQIMEFAASEHWFMANWRGISQQLH
ncbi:hypothetical protein CC86DRAFT_411781 [Ophiobolus disseminans]|uniref:Zn(2)-C6 fungal-type domain-containing protein n=1 Tax=Ophiobolus disseminans TaxID=1469910 RepID=A0A6A6ZHG9_9PLEO|nr:hypothetical protein CC86DRAFT_411781 [Ophiobolus disseminans]